MRWVVDASVALKWVLPEPGHEAARRLLDSGDELRAPDLLLLEAANALTRHVRLGSLNAVEAAGAFVTLKTIPLQLQASEPLIPAAMRLALKLEHSVYDCIYLALAMATEARFVTADRRFVAACQQGGYESHISLLH